MTRKHLQSWLNITPCTFWNCWAAGQVFLLQKSLKLSSHSSNVTCRCPWSQYSFLVWHEKPLLLNRIRYWHTYRWFHLSLPQWEVSLLNLNDWKHNPMYPMPGMPSSGLGTRCIPLFRVGHLPGCQSSSSCPGWSRSFQSTAEWGNLRPKQKRDERVGIRWKGNLSKLQKMEDTCFFWFCSKMLLQDKDFLKERGWIHHFQKKKTMIEGRCLLFYVFSPFVILGGHKQSFVLFHQQEQGNVM